jgi:HK97 family phage portal protein
MGLFDFLRKRQARELTETQWFEMFDRSQKAKAGVAVNANTAIYSAAVAAVVGLRAKTLASLPLHVYRDSGGKRVKAVDHPAYRLLKNKPNPSMTAPKFWRWVQMQCDLYDGNAYVWKDVRVSRLVGLYPILGKTEPIVTKRNGIAVVEGYKNVLNGVETIFPAAEVLHFTSEFMDADGIKGRSLVDVCRESIGIDMAAEEFFGRVLANGTHMGVVIVANEQMTDVQFEDLKQQMADGRGVAPAGKVRFFRNAKPEVIGMTVKDADLTEQRRFAIERICGVAGIPPSFVGDIEKLTYSNAEQADISLAKHCIRNIAVDHESVLNSDLLSADVNLYVKFDLNGLQRGDFKTRMEGYALAVNAGIMVPDEARAFEDMDPIPGGDKLRFPVNTIPAEMAEDYFDRDSGTDAMQPVEDEAASRIRAKFERDGDTDRTRKFAELVTAPIAAAYDRMGKPFDSQRFIEEAVNG